MLRGQMIREGLPEKEATARFWALDRQGLLTDDQGDRLHDFQVPYARPASEVAGWAPVMAGGAPMPIGKHAGSLKDFSALVRKGRKELVHIVGTNPALASRDR
jgi:Malic enzyme, NAD binding domain